MANEELILLDTRAIDKAIAMREEVLTEFDAINEKFDGIVEKLLDKWKGAGADAFRKDAQTVRTNITGLNDILKTMCDMLEECREIFAKCDSALGEFNKNPQSE